MKDGQLDFVGEVKTKPKFKASPVVDRIMSNVHDEEMQRPTEARGMVTLRVPSNPNEPNGMRSLDINLNGKNYSLARDVTATVPKEPSSTSG